MADTIYTFEDFQIDPARNLLTRDPDGDIVPLTHKAFHVLLVLIENRGDVVSKGDLMSTVWKDTVVEESNLTQTISMLRKALGEKPSQHRFIVTESGKGYRFVAPVAESNGKVEVQQSDVAETRNSTPDTKNYFLAGLVAALVLLAGGAYFFLNHGSNQSTASPPDEIKAIAVLPFLSVHPDEDVKLLGVGMADAVIARLSQIGSISVRQTSSVMRYADSTPEAVRIGREINVDAILEGTIQKADSRIRVSVRLFRVVDGSLLWADTFDEPEKDIFALQDAISERVATSLALQLGSEERASLNRRFTENLDAYHLYNKGRFFWNRRNSEDLRKSIVFYEQAIAIDPNYALAYAGIAESYVLLQLFSRSHDEDRFLKARDAAEKALSLDENLAEAHTALGLVRQQYEWNWEAADQEFKKAIAANPNYATAHQWYGEFLAFRGRTDDAVAQIEKALALDPLSLSSNTARAFPYLADRRFDEALVALKPALELDKNFPLALYYLARSQEGVGQYDEAIRTYERAIDASGSTFFKSAMIHSLVKSGQRERASQILQELIVLAKGEPISRYVIARGYAALGEREKALDELDVCYRTRDGLLIVLKIDPNFDEMHSEPRFNELVGKIGL